MRFDYGLLKPGIRRAFLNGQKLHYDDAYRNGADFGFYLDILMAGGRVAASGGHVLLHPASRDSITPSVADRAPALRLCGMRAMTDRLLAITRSA